MFNMLDVLGKIDVSHIPPEFLKKIQGVFVGLFGGQERFDCHITKLADDMADPNNPAVRPIKISSDIIPMDIQGLMHKPHEIVDLLIQTAESFELFGYSAQIKKLGDNGNFVATASDRETGHVIEEIEGKDPETLAISLSEKYGKNLEVVRV